MLAISARRAGCPVADHQCASRLRPRRRAGRWRRTCWSSSGAAGPFPWRCVDQPHGGRSPACQRPGRAGCRLARHPAALARDRPRRARSGSPTAQFFTVYPARQHRPVLAGPRGQHDRHGRRSLGWGMYIGSRRELIWTLRHRAETRRGRAGAAGRAGSGQRAGPDRPRDARRAGAPDLPGLDARRGAGVPRGPHPRARCATSAAVIRDKAHEALTDLRGVLGVLRDGRRRAGTRPAADVRRPGELVAEAREGGLNVELRRPGRAPATRCRTRPAGRSTGSCRRGSPTPASTRPARLLTVERQRVARGRPRRGACATRSAFGERRRPGAGLGSGRARRAGRAARRPARAPPRGRAVRAARLDPVGGMIRRSVWSSTTTRWCGRRWS